MDYPHPWITLDASGKPDLSHAYATGIGAWDKVAIQYGYSQFAREPMSTRHSTNPERGPGHGLYFITDAGRAPARRRPSSCPPLGSGPDPARN